ncbi:MAG: hypothetical protein ACC707_21250 [Thiohalomonadales bacterium]
MDDISATISKPRPLPLQFGEFCDILGGQTWLQFIYNLKSNHQQYRVKIVSKYKPSLTGKNRFLCSGDLLERQALEIFYIKLSLISRITVIVRDAHKLLNAPLLTLTASSIRIALPSAKTLAPSLWNYELAFEKFDPQSTSPFVNPHAYDEDYENKPQHDFYCIGMLIARALLVNYNQTMDVVKTRLDETANLLSEIYIANCTELDPEKLKSKLLQVLDSFLNDNFFQQCNVIFRPNYYNKDLIDPHLWRTVIYNCFRLITNIPGFSYYAYQDSIENTHWDIAEDLNLEISDIEHQAKRNLLSESLNPSTDLYELATELTRHDNWQAMYFDNENSLNNEPLKEELIDLNIFDFEDDLTYEQTLQVSPTDHGRNFNSESSAALEFVENIADD